ncbi:hypothetical protein SeSA_B0058 (plasmid) [Salmonella enterica subsp. enterica serovar Schwarzengrund str. CVM19633]|uniref:Uncharacterized protein n=1 Tax=Salmonella schwarzengrund (strain CVM19633) TaxID=439843 RepID=A0A0U1RFD4_SALSV|nr:hypothetical protein SeSA_B0058 [Salmonella enterica subsp. enterica serovar Schwarzengrund str. CVM19633]
MFNGYGMRTEKMEQFYFLFFKILCPIRVIFHNFNFHDSFVLASKTMFGIILHISPVQE